MIGFYDYTVVLTYLSLLSAGSGIFVSLSGSGHPYWGTFFLLFCGLCDAFDGQVARTKKNRTEQERSFGIQIDSLSDLVAFGVLPACIGMALIRTSPIMQQIFHADRHNVPLRLVSGLCFAVMVLYILAALIRLAYFNVTEEERQRTEGGVRRTYTGLPVTSAALIFPSVMLFRYLLPMDISILYFPTTLITGFLFLSKLRIPKPHLRGVLIMIGIGAIEGVLLVLFFVLRLKELW